MSTSNSIKRAEIFRLAGEHRVAESAAESFANDQSKNVSDFVAYILETRMGAQRAGGQGEIGMTRRELRAWSLANVLRTLSEEQPLTGLEKEVSDETARILRRKTMGCFIPKDILKSNLQESHDVNPMQAVSIAQGMRALNVATQTAVVFSLTQMFWGRQWSSFS